MQISARILCTLLILLYFPVYSQDKHFAAAKAPVVVVTGDRAWACIPDSMFFRSLPDCYTDSLYEAWPVKRAAQLCKQEAVAYLLLPMPRIDALLVKDLHGAGLAVRPMKPSLLTIHGNTLYNMDYRSNIDTPYMERDLYQHTIQTYLDITVKDQYPLRVYLTNRFSNSTLFRNFSDLNLQFNPQEFSNKLRQRMKNIVLNRLKTDSLSLVKAALRQKIAQLNGLQTGIVNPAILQRNIEARERAWYGLSASEPPAGAGSQANSEQLSVSDQWNLQKGRLPGLLRDQLAGALAAGNRKDTMSTPWQVTNTEKPAGFLQKQDSLVKEIRQLQALYQQRKNEVRAYKHNLEGAIDEVETGAQLRQKLNELHIQDSSLPKGYRFLWNMKSISAGRSIVNYSELSAKNTNITGIQAVYNPSYYLAFASGVVDYRFRDYIVQRNTGPRQYLNLIRAGWGQMDGNNVIVTYYTGKRQLYNSSTTLQSNALPNYRLMGFTIESNYRLNPVSRLSLELAKSSLPYYNQPVEDKNLLTGTLRFNDHSNEAYSIKLSTVIRPTGTQLNAFYKRLGANFQSFSLFTTGARQTAWLVKLDQVLFNRLLTLSAAVKQNDYSNPFADRAYNSKAVFKSLQATLRLKKGPVLLLGYYPSSQLTKTGEDRYAENLFYTLVANMSYYYHAGSTGMSSTLVYTQFYNKVPDSGFVYFNTRNLLLSQGIFAGNLFFQASGAVAKNAEYVLYSWDNEVKYAFRQWLSVGGGIRYNRQTVYQVQQWGYAGSLVLKIKQLGDLELVYDKNFIPGMNRRLVANKTGRVGFFKTF